MSTINFSKTETAPLDNSPAPTIEAVEVATYMVEHEDMYEASTTERHIVNGCLYSLDGDAHIPLKLWGTIEDGLPCGAIPLAEVYTKIIKECSLTFQNFEHFLIRSGVNITTSYFILPVDMDDAATLCDTSKVLQLAGPLVPYLTRV